MTEKKQFYKNVMELLVDQEIDFQIKHNKRLKSLMPYLDVLDVATYALNRLPPLYASSNEGIERQKRKAKQNFKRKIEQAVSLGFAAVENDPLRTNTPIQEKNIEPNTLEQAKKTLPQLSDIIPKQELTWIVKFTEHFLERVKNKEITHEEVIKLYYLLYYYWQDNY